MVHTVWSPGLYCFPSRGEPQMCRWAYGVPANMTIVPPSRITVPIPAAFASNGQMSIQCGPIGIAGWSLRL